MARASSPSLVALRRPTGAVLAWPFWVGPRTLLPIFEQTRLLVWSPASVLVAISTVLPGGPYDGAVRAVLGVLWVVACAWLLLWRRVEQPAEVAATSAWLLVATLGLLSGAVYAHYLVPVVALTAVAGDRRLERVVVWLSVGGLAVYALDLLGLALWPDWLGSVGYRILGSLVLFGPAALALRRAAPAVAEAGERDWLTTGMSECGRVD